MRLFLFLLLQFLAIQSDAFMFSKVTSFARSSVCFRTHTMPLKTTTNIVANNRVRSSTNLQMGLLDMFQPDAIIVSKVQIAVNCPDRAPRSLLGTMDRLAEEADPDEISELVSDVALTLLRKESDWISGAVESFKTTDEEKADDAFQEMSLKERAKVERETVNLVGDRDRSESRVAGKPEDLGKPTVAVVTFILALDNLPLPEVKDLKDMRAALTAMGGFAGTESLLAAEVMWTPEEPHDTITPEQVYLDYPKLLPF